MTRGRRSVPRAAGAYAIVFALAGAAFIGCNDTTEPPAHVYYVTFADSDSITEGNNLQAELSVDRLGYDFGDTLRLHLALHNIGVLGTRITFSQRYDITVDDMTQPHRVYEWIESGPQQQVDLPAESTLVATRDPIEWDMRDSVGAALPTGHQYLITATPFQIVEAVLAHPRLVFHTRTPSP